MTNIYVCVIYINITKFFFSIVYGPVYSVNVYKN